MLAALSSDPWLFVPALALLGLCVGSFLNVVVYRLPRVLEREWWDYTAQHQLGDEQAWQTAFGRATPRPDAVAQAASVIRSSVEKLPPMTLARPRSRCPHCGHQLRWYENIPLVGWFALRGRCSACAAPPTSASTTG